MHTQTKPNEIDQGNSNNVNPGGLSMSNQQSVPLSSITASSGVKQQQ